MKKEREAAAAALVRNLLAGNQHPEDLAGAAAYGREQQKLAMERVLDWFVENGHRGVVEQALNYQGLSLDVLLDEGA